MYQIGVQVFMSRKVLMRYGMNERIFQAGRTECTKMQKWARAWGMGRWLLDGWRIRGMCLWMAFDEDSKRSRDSSQKASFTMLSGNTGTFLREFNDQITLQCLLVPTEDSQDHQANFYSLKSSKGCGLVKVERVSIAHGPSRVKQEQLYQKQEALRLIIWGYIYLLGVYQNH